MFISEKRLKANRLNAQKSTGPKTPEGKAKASQNAIKHGLYSRRPIITCSRLPENQTNYDSLLASVTAKLNPNSTLERFLVRRIANCTWQLIRSDKCAASQLNPRIDALLSQDDPTLPAVASLYHRLLIFNQRLQHRIDMTYIMVLAVKRSHFPAIIQQLTEALDNFSNRCATNPLIERVL